MSRMRLKWKRGEKKALAQNVGIKPSYFSDILSGRRTPRPELAEKIQQEAYAMGIYINVMDLLYNHSTKNPLFNTERARNGNTSVS